MNKLVILIIFILSNLQIYADWEEVEIPYGNGYIEKITVGEGYVIATGLHRVFRLDSVSNQWDFVDSSSIIEDKYFNALLSFSDTIIATSDFGNIISFDSGNTWSDFEVAEELGNIRFLSKNDEYLFASTSTGYFRTKRGETNWIKMQTPVSMSGNSIFSSGSNIIVSEKVIKNLLGEIIAGGLYLTDDNGNNWNSYFEDKNVTAACISGDTIIATVDLNLYVSFDFGVTWKSKEISEQFSFVELLNEEIYLFPYSGNYIKYDLELTKKELITSELNKQFTNSVVKSNNRLYIGTSAGMYIYEPTENEFVNNSPNSPYGNYFSITEYDNKLLATGFNIGTKISNEKGENWSQFSKNLDSLEISPGSIVISDGLFFGRQYGSQQLIFSDDAVNWKSLVNPINKLIIEQEIWNENLYFFDNQDLYKSTDYGDSWETISTLIADNGFAPFITTTTVMEERFFVGTVEFGIFYSDNDGNNWQKSNFSNDITTSKKVWKLLNSFGKLYAIIGDSIEGYLLIEYNIESNLWISKANLGDKAVSNIIIIEDNIIWSTAGEINLSNDNGINKTPIVEGLKKTDLDFMSGLIAFNDYIYMINSNGMYRHPLSDFGITSVESEIERNYLYTFPPYPLPAKSEVKVLFYWDINLPMTVDDISIYDLNGQKIPTSGNLRLEKQASHKGNIIWDCSSAESGVYIINIKHGTEEKSVKVIKE